MAEANNAASNLCMPVLTERAELVEAIRARTAAYADIELVTAADTEDAIDLLRLEMPEICIVDMASATLDAAAIFDACRHDPWLLGGGLIVIYSTVDQGRRLAELPGLNLVVALREGELANNLLVVLEQILANRRLLAHRGLGLGLMENFSARFELPNNLLVARCHANLVCNFLFAGGRITATQKQQLQLGLVEMLFNAIEHGNCGISAAEKTAHLEAAGDMQALIQQRQERAENRGRRVTLDYQISEGEARFCIRDEGAGFDWQRQRVEEPDELALHGRGIMMAENVFGELAYNELGNEVNFSFAFQADVEPLRPQLLAGIEQMTVAPGDSIIEADSFDRTLYFIVRGEYEVLANEQRVALLNPDDIFIGEMAFLLAGRRSATVRAISAGQLVPISRQALVKAIRSHPHYGLFFARLLAQRLDRLNRAQA